MKKSLIFLVLIMFAATAAFAKDVTSNDEGLTITANSSTGPVIAKLSANVRADINYTAATYAIATKATNGTKIYATAADDTSIYAKDGTAKTPLAAADLGDASDSSAFASGWTEM